MGQLGGAITEHNEIITQGKNLGKSNESTPLQQAESQAKSDWLRKKDEGYKSLEDLEIYLVEGESDMYASSKGFHCLFEALDHSLPKFNSGAAGVPLPMLAKPVNWDKVIYPCYVQPKLDGVRSLMVVGTTDDILNIKFLSRTGKEYTTLSHIKADVTRWVTTQDIAPASFILDGQVYSDELSFQEIVAAVKKQRPNSLLLKFRCYDMIDDLDQVDRALSTRFKVEKIGSPYITWVETGIANSKVEVLNCHNQWVQQGYEGAMIRLYEGHYAQGQRSSHLLKVKEFDTTEFALLRFEFGQRGVEDLIAVCMIPDGREFRAKMQGTKSSKEQLYADMDDLEGRSITVKHFGYTDDGLPRFPIGVAVRDYE